MKAKIPLHLILGQIFAHLSGEVIEAVQSAGMKEGISRLPEHSRDLVVVVGHQLRFRGLLGQSKEAVDVLNSFKCFLFNTDKMVNDSKGFNLFKCRKSLRGDSIKCIFD